LFDPFVMWCIYLFE